MTWQTLEDLEVVEGDVVNNLGTLFEVIDYNNLICLKTGRTYTGTWGSTFSLHERKTLKKKGYARWARSYVPLITDMEETK